jgi:threonine/homoserine/homoserine lactone efflux protein
MISADTSLAFFFVSVLLALTPGPDNIFVLVQSALRGRSAGMYVVLGLCTGLVVHTTAVAIGLAALFAASAMAFAALKMIGAAYLCYLAWRAFRAPLEEIGAATQAPVDAKRMYARGVVMNLTNPKVVIFFLAFLPQFTQPESGHLVLQLLWLGFLFIVATLLVFGAIAHFAGALGALLRQSPRVQRALDWTAAAVFLALALRLVIAER